MSGRASQDPAAPARRAGLIAVAVVGALAVVLLAVSTSGPVRVRSEPPPSPVETVEPILPDGDGAVTEQSEGPAGPAEPSDGWFMRIVALLVGLLLLRYLWMAIAGWWAILRMWRPGTRRRPRRAGFQVLPGVGAPPEVVLDEAAQIEALRGGSARNAIVACWMRLEDDVAAAGVAPRPSETSAELTARVLDAALADRSAVEDLAERYREARFSAHPIGEHERELALGALARIHASLRRPSPVAEDVP